MTATDDRAATRHRVFGFFRAPETAAGFILLVAFAFIWTWSYFARAKESEEPQGPLMLEASLVTVEDEGFFVEVKLDRPAFITLLLRRPDAPDSQVFPRLGPPPGLPWPLEAKTTYRLPEAEGPFRRPLAADEVIIVLARRDRPAGDDGDLPDDAELGARVELRGAPR